MLKARLEDQYGFFRIEIPGAGRYVFVFRVTDDPQIVLGRFLENVDGIVGVVHLIKIERGIVNCGDHPGSHGIDFPDETHPFRILLQVFHLVQEEQDYQADDDDKESVLCVAEVIFADE